MPARPPDSFYSQRKGKKTRAGGMGHQKEEKEKQTYLANKYVHVKRQYRGKKIEIKTTGHLIINLGRDMILLVWQLKHSTTEVEANLGGE